VSQEVSRRYAKAFLDVASERNEEEKCLKELQVFANLYAEDDSFRQLVLNPVFQESERISVVEKILSKTKSGVTAQVIIKYLIQRNRLSLLPKITEEYFSELNVKRGKQPVSVWSATALDKAEQTKLSKLLHEITGKEISLVLNEDPELIGGIKIKVGSVVLESSLKHNLEKMRQELIGYS